MIKPLSPKTRLPYSAILLNDAPVAYYRLNGVLTGYKGTEPELTASDSFETIDGSPVRTDSDRLYALLDAAVLYADNAVFDIGASNGGITVSAWCYWTSAGDGEQERWLVNKDFYSGTYRLRRDSNNKFSFRVHNGTTAGVATSATVGESWTWYHVVGVYSIAEGLLKIYINGRLDNNPVTFSGGIGYSPSQPFEIGGSYGGDRYWLGGIDEVALFDYPLTNDQILAHYRSSGRM